MIDAPMVARIDHVSEPGASCVAEKHVSVDFIEAVAGTRPAHAFAMGDAPRIFQRPSAAGCHKEAFRLTPRSGEVQSLRLSTGRDTVAHSSIATPDNSPSPCAAWQSPS